MLTGSTHVSDADRPTTYDCSTIFINGERVYVHSGDWTASQKESRSSYVAPLDQALGRWHSGDENFAREIPHRRAALAGPAGATDRRDLEGTVQRKAATPPRAFPNRHDGRLHAGGEAGNTRRAIPRRDLRGLTQHAVRGPPAWRAVPPVR